MPYTSHINFKLDNKKYKKLNPVDHSLVSDALYEATIGKLNKNKSMLSESFQTKTEWIHLIDSVSRGYTTPAEAWDCVKLGYVMENLKVRKSAYAHLI